MKIIFTRNHLPLSPIVRFITWSEYSHCGFISKNNMVIEAKFSGVQSNKLSKVISGSSKSIIYELDLEDEQKAENFLLLQIGKDYDISALFGIFLHRDWQKDDKWFCSELLAKSIIESGSPFIPSKYLNRITPQDLLFICQAHGRIVDG